MFTRPALFAAMMLVYLAGSIAAQDSIYLSYQGRLTDDSGNPLSGFYDLTFTIYDESGGSPVSTWSGQYSVEISAGLFSQQLGPIPEAAFTCDQMYLGIQVGTGPEITPRTLLTAATLAVKAYGVTGDIETGQGSMVLKGSSGDSAIVLDGGSGKGIPNFSMYFTQPLDKRAFEMYADPSLGGEFNIYGTEPLDKVFSIGHNTTEGASFKMFGTQTPPAVLFELNRAPTEGTVACGLYAPAGSEVMGVEPSPFNDGYNLRFYNPLPEGEAELVRVGSRYGSKGTGADIILFNPDVAYSGEQLVSMSSDISDGGNIRFFQPQPEPPGTPPDPCLDIGVNLAGFGSIKMFQPQPEPPGQEAIGMYTQTAKGGGGNVFIRNFSDSISTSLAGGEFSLMDFKSSDGPSMTMGLYADSSSMTLTGKVPPFGGQAAYIEMFADQGTAKVGIGQTDREYNLFVVGDIGCTGDVFTYTDTKMKSNIEPIGKALDIIGQINGVKYDWNSDTKSDLNISEGRQVGLLASDIEKVLPEIVKADQEGNKMVAYTKLTAVLVEAVKELKAENDQLRQRIERLEAGSSD